MNYSLYEMASLLVLLNRAVSYFNKLNTDVDDHNWIECIFCDRHINPQYYNFEREKCNDCCLLTQNGEKRCVACNEFDHITFYEPAQMHSAKLRLSYLKRDCIRTRATSLQVY
jgi:hypothetical protein